MGYKVVNVEDIEAAGPGRAVRFVRRELGLEAFGLNWFELPPGAAGIEHDEASTRQEEVNVVVRGSGIWRVDGEEVPVREGTFLRFDAETTPQTRRRPGRDDLHRHRRPPRQLRAARSVLETDLAGRPEAFEEAAVVRDEDDRAAVAVQRPLELLHGPEVEVVGRLVEDEQVHAPCLQLGEVRARPLAR